MCRSVVVSKRKSSLLPHLLGLTLPCVSAMSLSAYHSSTSSHRLCQNIYSGQDNIETQRSTDNYFSPAYPPQLININTKGHNILFRIHNALRTRSAYPDGGYDMIKSPSGDHSRYWKGKHTLYELAIAYLDTIHPTSYLYSMGKSGFSMCSSKYIPTGAHQNSIVKSMMPHHLAMTGIIRDMTVPTHCHQ